MFSSSSLRGLDPVFVIQDLSAKSFASRRLVIQRGITKSIIIKKITKVRLL